MKTAVRWIFVIVLLLGIAPLKVTAAPAEDPFVTNLIKHNGEVVGNVKVWNDTTTLYVRYEATEDWCLRETRLHVADHHTAIPTNPAGKPKPEKFTYKTRHDCATDYTYTIPLAWPMDQPLYLAADAAMSRLVCRTAKQCDEKGTIGNNPESAVECHKAKKCQMTGKVDVWGQGMPFSAKWPAMYIMYTPDSGLLPPIVPPTTNMLPPETTQALASVSPDGAYTFDATTPALANVQPGEIIVGEPCAAAPDGFLERVASVTPGADGSLVMQTEPTTLEEAIQQGELEFSEALSPANITRVEMAEGVLASSSQVMAAQAAISFPINRVVLYDADGNLSTTHDQITATGGVTIDPRLSVSVSVRNWTLERFQATVSATETADLAIDARVAASVKREVDIGRIYFTPITRWVGWVPVVFTPVLIVSVGMDGSVHVAVTTSVTQTASVVAGMRYQNGSWTPIQGFTSSFTHTPPVLSGNVNLKVYADAKYNVLLYGVIGPYVGLQAYLGLEADTSAVPWWTLYRGLGVLAGARMEILGRRLADYQATLIDFRQVLQQAPPDMAFVPAGTFQMGCNGASTPDGCSTQPGRGLPLHTVYLDAYLIDMTEVTNAQYAACVAAGVCTPDLACPWATHPDYCNDPGYARYPVFVVSWHQASAYCAWLGRRLPTEAEWEKAARGANDLRAYPWGDQPPTCELANYAFGESSYPEWDNTCVGHPTAVGSYPAGASPYRALDMAGNVSEWVNDWWQEDYYSVSPGSNPPGPAEGTAKVVRGGAWAGHLGSVWTRFVEDPAISTDSIGFRCADSP